MIWPIFKQVEFRWCLYEATNPFWISCLSVLHYNVCWITVASSVSSWDKPFVQKHSFAPPQRGALSLQTQCRTLMSFVRKEAQTDSKITRSLGKSLNRIRIQRKSYLSALFIRFCLSNACRLSVVNPPWRANIVNSLWRLSIVRL